ncbi:2-oxoglutarate (2OG) and Fe(II)-dependent oxygenase superfamily protein [Hibiscus syriacus]|uniref:2-oxoglutarate (2OG) and Fe(II)-dependent oxygenase superfamily protein n=1 Tax=Hibiscus syriacus TaxID=106335 RepID=A0A6A2XW86_HIBSY|nr:uncharacterized protein LOC120160440 [Hibiscus syriacus]KAE8680003.1 2-oxoglutarate (2OG) and Fe(II)-dependent oxygenase superfamily protein [Hibiscus syriacus]
MGRFAIAIAKAKTSMLREAKRSFERPLSKIASADRENIEKCRKSSSKGNDIKVSWSWVPHPRSGIYFPEGHEWVMKDVPEGAASLDQTYWLRNVDGVDKPEPSDREYFPSDQHYSHANI